jgi:hypothetical protein
MFDFRLGDAGQIELADIAESTSDRIMETCYPELNQTLATADLDKTGSGYSVEGQKQILEAVEKERTRLWDSQPAAKEAETSIGREIQKRMGAASVVVNRTVREAGLQRLKSTEGEGKKPK